MRYGASGRTDRKNDLVKLTIMEGCCRLKPCSNCLTVKVRSFGALAACQMPAYAQGFGQARGSPPIGWPNWRQGSEFRACPEAIARTPRTSARKNSITKAIHNHHENAREKGYFRACFGPAYAPPHSGPNKRKGSQFRLGAVLAPSKLS